jgi:hypothetical protein
MSQFDLVTDGGMFNIIFIRGFCQDFEGWWGFVGDGICTISIREFVPFQLRESYI